MIVNILMVSFMAYTAHLNNNQQLTVENQGMQTVITLISSSPGQQQSQSNSFTTGSWTAPPQLFKLPSSFVLQLESDRGSSFVRIQANSISTTTTPPALNDAVEIEFQEVPNRSNSQSQSNSGFEPMQPMQMGNMSMDINKMSMRMGNMSMDLGSSATSTSTKRFCSQCGEQVKKSDRFCASCGHQLNN